MTNNNKNKTEEAYNVICVSPPNPRCPLNNLARQRPKEGEGE